MRKRKKNYILIISILVLSLGLGYAYLTTTLSINGTTDVDSNTWNVYWDNVQVKEGSVTAPTPVIDSNKTTVTFSVHLSKPGDFYEFTVDAKNDGTIDAMIDAIEQTVNNSYSFPSYLLYSVEYVDRAYIEHNHLLAANTKETYRITIRFLDDINPEDLPTSSQSLNIKFAVEYIQANSDAQPVRETLYYTGNKYFQIGFTLPKNITTYDNYQDAAAFGNSIFLKHIVTTNQMNPLGYVHNIVLSSYVGFVLNNNDYYIRGAGATLNSGGVWLNDSKYYEDNKSIMKNAFGENNCQEDVDGSFKSYSCSLYGINASASTDGYVMVSNDYTLCHIYSDGNSTCGEG